MMRSVEERFGKPLSVLLIDAYKDGGLLEICARFSISKGTAYYWLLHEGIRLESVALRQDEFVEVKRK